MRVEKSVAGKLQEGVERARTATATPSGRGFTPGVSRQTNFKSRSNRSYRGSIEERGRTPTTERLPVESVVSAPNRPRNGNENRSQCPDCGRKHLGKCLLGSGICYRCGQPGHMRRDCPRRYSGGPSTGSTERVSQVAEQTPIAHSEGPSSSRGRGQGRQPRGQGRLNAMTQQEADEAQVVSGTLSFYNKQAHVLFDTGASHSFISATFMHKLDGNYKSSPVEFVITTPVGGELVTRFIIKDCEVHIEDSVLIIDMIPLDMQDFDIILGMDFMSKYQTILDCHRRVVTIRCPKGKIVQFQGERKILPTCTISTLKGEKLLRKGCEAYLAYVINTQAEKMKIEDIPVVREFPDVFPEELPGLPPVREVEFSIDLILGTGPISRAPYRMAPVELSELKVQLQELLDKGYIRPSISPWGAS